MYVCPWLIIGELPSYLWMQSLFVSNGILYFLQTISMLCCSLQARNFEIDNDFFEKYFLFQIAISCFRFYHVVALILSIFGIGQFLNQSHQVLQMQRIVAFFQVTMLTRISLLSRCLQKPLKMSGRKLDPSQSGNPSYTFVHQVSFV